MLEWPKDEQLIESAIEFLATALNASRKHTKPVLLHSIRVAFLLRSASYDEDVVIAAILHDIIEDTDVRIDCVQAKFGGNVARLVAAISCDEKIKDDRERFIDSFNRCDSIGRDALIIRAADFYDNLDYYHLARAKELSEWLNWKLEYFIRHAKNELKDEPTYQELVGKRSLTRK